MGKVDFTVCGIDEAGRGPVIGPMVVAGVLCNKEQLSKIIALGVKDSKLHTKSERDELFGQIKKIVSSYKIVVSSNHDIDAALNSSSMNLNLLEQEKYVAILNEFSPTEGFMDCPSINAKKFSSQIKGRVKSDMRVVCEHKADVNYPIVSAASILAKVTRDAEIEKIKNQIGEDFGSGYPSDPKTQFFLKNNYKKYDIFRKSWKSYKRLVVAESQSELSNF